MRTPSLQEEVDALRDRYFEDERERKFVEAERTRERLVCEGWRSAFVNARGRPQDALHGAIEALQDTLHPWGAPEHMSDRKSKRKRGEKRSPFKPWYQRDGTWEIEPCAKWVEDDRGVHPPESRGGTEAGVLGRTERDDAK